MQSGCIGHYSGLVCEPSQYDKASQVHLSHLVQASGELGIDGIRWQLLFYPFESSISLRLYIPLFAADRVLNIHNSFSGLILKVDLSSVHHSVLAIVIVSAKMKDSCEAYRLLREDADFTDNLELLSPQPRSSRRFSMRGIISILITAIFVFSLVLNNILIYYIIQLGRQLETAGATQFGLSTVLYFTISQLTSLQQVLLSIRQFRMNGILRTMTRIKHLRMSSGRISNPTSMLVLLR